MGRPKKNKTASSYVPKKVQALPGAEDVIAQANPYWRAIISRLQKTCRIYGFEKAETPQLEDLRLYENFYKDTPLELSKVLSLDLNGQLVALKAAFLPGVLRSYYQHKVYETNLSSKWAYWGSTAYKDSVLQAPMQDVEFGFEVFGNFNHLAEAQLISGVWHFLQSLGLKEVILEINSIGQSDCQVAYQGSLQDFFTGKKYELCDSCNEHLSVRPMNVFRCGNLDCQAIASEAPTILDFLDQISHKHFTSILEALDELAIPYQLNPLYVGPQGFSKTNFVIKARGKDKTFVIGEGGYHDQLLQNLCGKNYCCFGFTGSLLEVKKAMEEAKVEIVHEQKSEVFLVPLGELASKKSLRLFRDLVLEKVLVYDNFGDSGVKNQLKAAETFKAPIALIMGQKEAVDEMVILRDVKSGMQEIISYDKIVEEVKKRLGR